MLLELEIREPNRQPRTITIRQPKTVIGRSSRADIKLASDLVSSSHAALKVYSDGCVVEDLGSSNGTFVNGQRITSPTDCPNGTKVQLGVGGPTITIVGGSSEPPTVAKSDHQSAAPPTVSASMGLWLTGGVGLMLLAMFLLCGVGGIGIAMFRGQAAGPSGPRGAATLNDSVALICCGWRITTSTGTISEEPSLVNVLAVDGVMSDPDYVKRFVKVEAIRVGQRGDEEVHYEALLGTSGTGFPITKDGYMLTNKHVVEEVDELLRATEKMSAVCKMNRYSEAIPTIWVFVDGEPYPADIVYVSKTYDLAIIKCSQPTPQPLSLSKATELEPGMDVVALGFPGAVRDMQEAISKLLGRDTSTLGASGTVKGFLPEGALVCEQTHGKINSQRTIAAVDVIMHAARIRHGNSGGPLVSANGTVIGINTWGDDESDVNASQMLSQMRAEIDRHVPRVRWVK